ncbi:hypothetical protein QOZ80_2BG0166250 [Eleusine coracana subsp. coracana]|nr:hypothetical protein QOZ80_2BG0166250 [Eleusine coracana subsp. coracana]
MAEEPKIVEASSAVKPAEGATEKEVAPATQESKALVIVENAEKPAATGGLEEREAFLKSREQGGEKARRHHLLKNSKVAQMEAELKNTHEKLEMKKVVKVEKLKNAAAAVRREAEEKRAAAAARRGEEVVKAAAAAARYRDRGQAPTGIFGVGLLGRG